jgi:hypothetical protein
LRDRIVGLDLDNTLIDYSKSVELYSTAHLKIKFDNIFQIRKALKNASRETDWQKAQAWIYTEGLEHAKLSEGARSLFERLSLDSTPVFIVSHKTSRTPEEFGHLDLRGPARVWIRKNIEPFGIDSRQIYFEASRVEKIQRISDLKVTDFVDDLIEVLTDENFPKNVKRYLYDPYRICEEIEPNIEIVRRLDQV